MGNYDTVAAELADIGLGNCTCILKKAGGYFNIFNQGN